MALVEARGLKHFLRYLKAVGDKSMPAQLRLANLEVAKSLAAEINSAAPVGTQAERSKRH
jgi:hypothetical protein